MEKWVEELLGTVKELGTAMTGGFNAIKDRQDKIESDIAAYKEWQKKGGGGWPIPMENAEPGDKFFYGYELAKQGKRLLDKINHPGYAITEEKREMLAKFFCLFLRAGVAQDPVAYQQFRKEYGYYTDGQGVVHRTGTTQLGDSGNVFPLPEPVESEILHFAREVSVLLQHARVWPMAHEKMMIPAESSGVAVAWGNTTAESDPVISDVELSTQELSAYAAVRNSTLADTTSDIVSWIAEVMAEACGLELDNQGFNGNGSPFTGILSSSAGYSVVLSGTNFSSMTADDLSSCIAKLDGQKKIGARFFMHGQIIHLVRVLKDSQNRPIFVDRVSEPGGGTIWGYPYSEVIKMPSTSVANTAFLNFCNLRYLAVGQRINSTALAVDPYGLWTTNRTRFKIYQRWAIVIGLANGIVRMLSKS